MLPTGAAAPEASWRHRFEASRPAASVVVPAQDLQHIGANPIGNHEGSFSNKELARFRNPARMTELRILREEMLNTQWRMLSATRLAAAGSSSADTICKPCSHIRPEIASRFGAGGAVLRVLGVVYVVQAALGFTAGVAYAI
jgi:hypothetical protein